MPSCCHEAILLRKASIFRVGGMFSGRKKGQSYEEKEKFSSILRELVGQAELVSPISRWGCASSTLP
jgi:hypothetical protein